ncbi:uncharacterized protein [Amphiura filiformis]|uniref:uncharacterized protein n=1 Tax=Amphiura filiformis TaxID=82378 RepID=UPI003B20C919
MRYIENKDLREWVKDSLRKAIFQKAHALAVQTGCEILVKLEDLADTSGSQYYATNSLQQAYRQGDLCEKPGEIIISGETGLPATQMVETAVQSCGGDNINYNGISDDGRSALGYGYISTDSLNIRHVVPLNVSRGQNFLVPSRQETVGHTSWSITQPQMVTGAVQEVEQDNYVHVQDKVGAPGNVEIKLEEEEEDDEEVIIEESLDAADRAEYHSNQDKVAPHEQMVTEAMDGVERGTLVSEMDGGSPGEEGDIENVDPTDDSQQGETKFMYQCVICRASFMHPSLIQEHVARAHMHLFEHQQPSYQPVVVPGAGNVETATKLASTAVAAAAAGAASVSPASDGIPQAAVIEQQDIPSTSRFPPDIKEPLVFYSTDESLMDSEPEQHASFITYPAPLPNFTKPISHALRSGSVHQAWSRFIREAAMFYLPAMPIEDGKAKIVYQYIGRTMYETYPCIKSDGDKPWTYFNKCLSINIRRLRSKRRAKSDGSGKTVAKLMGAPNS